MGSTRIKGNKLKLTIGSPGQDYWADVTEYELFNDEADADVTTFEDAANGGARDHKLKLVGIQSLDVNSLWGLVWDSTGEDVAVTLAPFGNETPTTAQPHFVFTATVGPKPTLGGAAGPGAFTFETEWAVINEPAKVTE